MSDSSKDEGVILELLKRFENHRLPRVLKLKTKVDKGHGLGETDIDYLERIFKDMKLARPLISRHPEFKQLVSQAIDLYKEIMSKALQNETH